jgi:hypothetical protein
MSKASGVHKMCWQDGDGCLTPYSLGRPKPHFSELAVPLLPALLARQNPSTQHAPYPAPTPSSKSAPPPAPVQNSPAECCDACGTTAGCNVWVYCGAGGNATCAGDRKPQECWLKKKVNLDVIKPQGQRVPGAWCVGMDSASARVACSGKGAEEWEE